MIGNSRTSLTRRSVVVGMGAAAAAIGSATAAAAQEASPAAEMREVTDMVGTVLVPAHPQRVIANSNSTLGNMLALGVKPIGADVNILSLPIYLDGMMDGITDVTGEDYIDLEKALSLNPDLLIAIWGSGGEGWNLENVERYKAAVTTFAYEQNYVYEEQIKQNLLDVAYALNVEDRAAAVIEAFDTRVAELRERVVDTGFDQYPVSVVRVFTDGTYSVRIGTSESIAFRALGIPQPEGQQNPEDFSINFSQEELGVLNDAHALLVYIDDGGDTTEASLQEIDLWRSLTPVREGRVGFVNSGIWNSIDMLGAMAILDDIENILLPMAGS